MLDMMNRSEAKAAVAGFVVGCIAVYAGTNSRTPRVKGVPKSWRRTNRDYISWLQKQRPNANVKEIYNADSNLDIGNQIFTKLFDEHSEKIIKDKLY